jgi:pSer/pThr/pTyr-binding forkhead associated (FHA) protein
MDLRRGSAQFRNGNMKPAKLTVLLALFGGLSAIVAFTLAAPYVGTLSHLNLTSGNPQDRFPFGSKWALVEYSANGAFLCGPLIFIVALASRGLRMAMLQGLLGFVTGGMVGYMANGGADLLGIAASGKFGPQTFLAEGIWSLMVPAAYALVIAVVMGFNMARFKRAIYASAYGAVASFIAVIGAGAIISFLVSTGHLHIGDSNDALTPGSASIPAWEACACAAGFAIGLIFARAERVSRPASLMLVLGRNEGREWNLDRTVNRVGSAEGLEVFLGKMRGVAPEHARILRHQHGYAIEETSASPVVLNGLPVVAGAYLNNGDTIGLGSAVLVFNSTINARAAGFPSRISVPMTAPPFQPAPVPTPAWTSPAQQPVPATAPASGVSAPSLVDAFGNQYSLHDGPNILGREAGVDVILNWEPSVSRHHAEIVIGHGSAHIRDLNSTNGTRVNGHVVQGAVMLQTGDSIQLGQVLLNYHW